MEKTLQMVFQNQVGNNVSINIAQVKDELTGEEVKALMQLIISKNIFETSGGNLITIMSATVVSKDVQELSVR
jgi:hypothetical protein